jgi:hypothetical protein
MPMPTVYNVGTVSAVVGGACTPGIPAATTTNDILLLFVEAANEPLNAITGYTRIGSGAVVQAAGLVTDLSAFYKVAGASESAPSITSTPQNHLIARIIGVRSADTAAPIHVVNTGLDNTTGVTFAVPGVTTTVADCLVFVALSTGTDSNTATASGHTNANLGSITERIDNWTSSGNGGGINVCSGTKATAGATGTTSVTVSVGNTKATMTFAVQGATAEPPAAPAAMFINQPTRVRENVSRFSR